MGAKTTRQRPRNVREDWLAWIPNEMNELFDDTRRDLESYNNILSIILDEALALCKIRQFGAVRGRAVIFVELFDRLAVRLAHVLDAIRDHGSSFGTLPNVKALEAANFRGGTAQRTSQMNSLLAKVLFRGRTRFFHKLDSLAEIVTELQKEARVIATDIADEESQNPERAWGQLEVLGYDLNTCMGETTVLLKSFFCAMSSDQFDVFRKKLAEPLPPFLPVELGRAHVFHKK